MPADFHSDANSLIPLEMWLRLRGHGGEDIPSAEALVECRVHVLPLLYRFIQHKFNSVGEVDVEIILSKMLENELGKLVSRSTSASHLQRLLNKYATWRMIDFLGTQEAKKTMRREDLPENEWELAEIGEWWDVVEIGPHPDLSPADSVASAELCEAIDRFLKDEVPEEAEFLKRYYKEGAIVIAAKEGVSADTIRKRAFDAKKKVVKALEKSKDKHEKVFEYLQHFKNQLKTR